jgi:MFS transporter, FSR family, fosmidomycin resistance protein
MAQTLSGQSSAAAYQRTAYSILFAVAVSHFVNDMLQSVFSSVYPMLRKEYALSYTQIGWITFAFQCTASILQPFVGNYTDRKPQPNSFIGGIFFSITGIVCLTFASGFVSILLAACLIGVGSSVFHPEASRVAHFASGGRRGLAQAIFQLGGNFGSAMSPLLVAAIVTDRGQLHILWFLIPAVGGIWVLSRISAWYRKYLEHRVKAKNTAVEKIHDLSPKRVKATIALLLVLIFSKYFYTASITNFLTFYMIEKFNFTDKDAQLYLFIYLGAVAAGTFIGGPLGDRFGRKVIIWFSILGVAPFTILLPHADVFWTGILIAVIGIILASAFSAILVFAQELMPGKTGMVSGLFYGFAFGIAGIGSALLGFLIERFGLQVIFEVCSYLPLLGLVAVFLPNIRKKRIAKA